MFAKFCYNLRGIETLKLLGSIVLFLAAFRPVRITSRAALFCGGGGMFWPESEKCSKWNEKSRNAGKSVNISFGFVDILVKTI